MLPAGCVNLSSWKMNVHTPSSWRFSCSRGCIRMVTSGKTMDRKIRKRRLDGV